jgi:hypothetical protein
MKDILVKGSSYQSSKLRKRLIKEGYFEHRCVSCKLCDRKVSKPHQCL